MKTITCVCTVLGLTAGLALVAGCGGNNSANDQLIGGVCLTADDCDDGDEDTPELDCLLDFKGGYCGRADCTADEDCPKGSICVVLEGTNYCFLVCTSKEQCNVNRDVESESNCSSNVDPVGGGTDKVCVPPAAG